MSDVLVIFDRANEIGFLVPDMIKKNVKKKKEKKPFIHDTMNEYCLCGPRLMHKPYTGEGFLVHCVEN